MYSIVDYSCINVENNGYVISYIKFLQMAIAWT